MTATFIWRFNGRMLLLFWSNTRLSCAIFSASSLCLGQSITENGMLLQGWVEFISPSSKRAFSSLLTDVLIFSSEIRSFFTASVMLLKLPPHSRSVPLKTASAEAWAASGCVSCFLRWKKSPIAPQSVTTIPLNPQSLRRIWVNRRLLPQQGSPSKRL